MDDPINILYLEDNKADFQLVRQMLVSEGMDFRMIQVASRKDYEAALEAGSWRLILADNKLPGYSGLEAIETARRKCPATPLLMVSGTLNEERAQDAFGRGAVECISKDRLSQLGTAVRKALQELPCRIEPESNEREAEAEALSILHARYRRLLDHSPVPVFLLSMDLKLLEWNPAAEELTGWVRDEVLYRNLREFLAPRYESVYVTGPRAALTAEEWNGEIGLRTKSGQKIILQSQWLLIRDAYEQAESFMVINTDLSEKKKLEEHSGRASGWSASGRSLVE
jgi:PAS domain S-box-containing protein